MRINTYNTVARDFATLANAMNRAFDGNFGPYDYARNGGSASGSNETQNGESAPTVRLPVDVWATDEAFTITAYLPGVTPEEVEITFEGEELTIRGQFPKPSEETQFIKRELFHGAFERRLGFNVQVNEDAIEATNENGLLTLRVPKAEVVKPKQIKVLAK